jgi:hypothetical protein
LEKSDFVVRQGAESKTSGVIVWILRALVFSLKMVVFPIT